MRSAKAPSLLNLFKTIRKAKLGQTSLAFLLSHINYFVTYDKSPLAKSAPDYTKASPNEGRSSLWKSG